MKEKKLIEFINFNTNKVFFRKTQIQKFRFNFKSKFYLRYFYIYLDYFSLNFFFKKLKFLEIRKAQQVNMYLKTKYSFFNEQKSNLQTPINNNERIHYVETQLTTFNLMTVFSYNNFMFYKIITALIFLVFNHNAKK